MYVGGSRTPAAIRGLRDLSSLKGASLSSAAEFHFFKESELKKTKQGIEIFLNQFVMRDESGGRNFVCQVEGRPGVFDRLEVTLEGIGISEAGKIPRIIVETDCKSLPDSKTIGQIKIFLPMEKLYGLAPKDQDLSFYDETNTQLRVVQMVSEWPRDWVLKSVRYFDSKAPEKMLSLDVPKNKGPSEGAFTLSWPIKTSEPVRQKF